MYINISLLYCIIRDALFFFLSLVVSMMVSEVVRVDCVLCGKVLEVGEAVLCSSCLDFVEWKYGSLKRYQTTRNKAFEAEEVQNETG